MILGSQSPLTRNRISLQNYRKMGTMFSIRCLYYSKDVALFPAWHRYCRAIAVRYGRQYWHALLLSISV